MEQKQKLYKEFKSHKNFQSVLSCIEKTEKGRVQLKGLTGSSRSLFSAALIENSSFLNFFLLRDKEEAAYFYNDLVNCLGEHEILFFPSSYKRSAQYNQPESGNIILRSNVLNVLSNKEISIKAIVSYPEAISEKVVSKEQLSDNTLQLHKGEKVSIEFIQEVLTEYHFELVDFVFEPGQYAIRGSLIDIFSFSAKDPYRLDFFGDEVETIRIFDPDSQLSLEQLDKISILPNLEKIKLEQARESLIQNAGTNKIIWCNDINFFTARVTQIFEGIRSADGSSIKNEDFLCSGAEILSEIAKNTVVDFNLKAYFTGNKSFEFQTRPQPAFQKNFTLLGDNLKQCIAENYNTLICTESEKQIARLEAIFKDTHQGINFKHLPITLHEGFIDDDLMLCCYTDHQIFERYHKYRLNTFQSNKASITIRELKDLKPGDYVTHIDHGIGRFGGLEKITVNGKVQEAIKLVYRDNDTIYVGIHSLHRISKYKGKDDSAPKIHKLGSGVWQKLTLATKKKVKDIAKELIALYAERKSKEGFSFSPDTYLQEELEASFIYEDTPDQLKSTKAVKADMESSVPMDRLICGDVGFGKTEIAIRAAFKAVADNKQVAILVPTTILALQHYRTFKERLKDFPCSVDYVSRLKKPSLQKSTLEKVEKGELDILVGTHRLLGKDVKFKNLGLMIIDEEQKFGVAAKEKLKSLKVNVDSLTMTATPIPRTLQFSLMGARDLSIINTPPPNRHPIITELHTLQDEIIQEGIEYEVSRGGQVFFIHNRVQSIFEVEALIKRLCPKVKTIVGHGQMDGPKLEQIMIDFISGDYDVLIATTIIESGLDIPNANTIFINNAQNFGLSDLHQLRGRVGRSNKKAFCYLLAPPVTTLTPEARRRLIAIEEFSDLGSGFQIAMQDLDIRGAGNMLGAEQSGFIADIGFEAYNRILDEAMMELKENEFKDLFASERKPTEASEDIEYVNDCIIDTDFEIHIPDKYVESITERIKLYRQLDNIQEDDKLQEFKAQIIDRFGKLPEATEKLFSIVKLRKVALTLGFEKIILKNGMFIGQFISNQNSPYYQSAVFGHILKFVQMKPQLFKMREGNNKLTLSVANIEDLDVAMDLLQKFKPNTQDPNL